jgi:hypothetical protein
VIDLMAEKQGGTWVRRFGDHEEGGLQVSINDKSAHVTVTELEITFGVDRIDAPAAWEDPIDVAKLREQLVTAIVRRMSEAVLGALFREFHRQRQRAFCQGEHAIQLKIREAIGL